MNNLSNNNSTTNPQIQLDQITEPTNNQTRSNFSQIVNGILNSDLNDIMHQHLNPSNNQHGHSHAGALSNQQQSTNNNNSQMLMNSALSNSDQVIINLFSNNSQQQQHENNSVSIAGASSEANLIQQNQNEHDHNHTHQQPQQQQQDMDAQNNNNFFFLAFKTLQSSLPFFVILVAKIFHQHLLGFFVVFGFMITLQWSNKTLVKQVELKDKKENYKLILLIVFLMLNVGIFFLIFKEYQLENCLIFLSTNIHKMDTWNLIWIVVCSDTIIKFFVISFKAFITLLPFNIVALRKRGNYYSTIETFALFYRCLTPIHPWILFIIHSEANLQLGDVLVDVQQAASGTPNTSKTSTLFPIILCVLYAIFKINQIYNSFNELVESTREFYMDMTYGIPVTLNEQEENICPICQDKYSNPVVLKCKHTFCQDCVCVWLDKENSCPMCRAKVSVKKPKHKDGSTTMFVQWF